MSSQYDLTDFHADVIVRSESTPVLVDFWAPWCGPCRMLAPSLEKLAAEAGGRWQLVKVNTDEHQDVAAQFSIRGIPDVKLFHHGKVVAEFSGALPEAHLRRWLAENLPSQDRAHAAEARKAITEGRFAEAEATLAQLHQAAPANPEIITQLALARVFRDPAGAAALLGGVRSPEADLVRTFARALVIDAAGLPEFSAKTPLLAGLAELRAGRFPEALRLLIASMEESVRYADGAARETCLALFRLLGSHHPLTLEFHRRYSMAANV